MLSKLEAKERYQGVVVPLATLFNDDRSIDVQGTAGNAQWIVDRGAKQGNTVFLIAGSGGDFSVLNMEERRKVIGAVAKVGRENNIPMMAVYPQAAEQRCWNHKIVNVLAKLPKRQQDQAKLMLRTIPYAPTRTEAERLRTVFTRWCGDHSYEAASEALERDWDRMVTFYDFPKEHWGHLRTTNPVESPFAALRLRTDAAKRYKRVDRAIAVIWKMLMVAEQRFRRLKAPELIEDVYLGAQYVDGIVSETTAEKVAA